jgi:hypothetical protein
MVNGGHRTTHLSLAQDISVDDGEGQRLPDVLSSVYLLIDQEIDRAVGTEDGTLSLSFKNNKTLHVRDSSGQSESYGVSVKGSIVVRV